MNFYEWMKFHENNSKEWDLNKVRISLERKETTVPSVTKIEETSQQQLIDEENQFILPRVKGKRKRARYSEEDKKRFRNFFKFYLSLTNEKEQSLVRQKFWKEEGIESLAQWDYLRKTYGSEDAALKFSSRKKRKTTKTKQSPRQTGRGLKKYSHTEQEEENSSLDVVIFVRKTHSVFFDEKPNSNLKEKSGESSATCSSQERDMLVVPIEKRPEDHNTCESSEQEHVKEKVEPLSFSEQETRPSDLQISQPPPLDTLFPSFQQPPFPVLDDILFEMIPATKDPMEEEDEQDEKEEEKVTIQGDKDGKKILKKISKLFPLDNSLEFISFF